MKKPGKAIVFFLILALASCADENESGNSVIADLLIGEWSHSIYSDTITTLTRMRSLPDDAYGISFLQDGELREWKNAGFCGTPPITYGEFKGNWEFLNDSTVLIQSTYWGGEMVMKWHILKIDEHKLKFWINHEESVYLEFQ